MSLKTYYKIQRVYLAPAVNRCWENEQRTSNSRKGQQTSQKYRNLVGSDQQMQRLEKTELRKADRMVGVNCI